ncbi:MAG: HEAT repeat domain-containing protein [Phycisphaerales bacterium]
MPKPEWLLCTLALCAITGCASSPTSTASAPLAPPARPAARPMPMAAPASTEPVRTEYSAVDQSQLRERALQTLAAASMNPAAEQRANAIEALLPVPGRLEPVVRRAVADENLAVRAIAATAIGKARLKSSADFVRPLLNDPAPMVRMGAIYALARCGESVDQSPLAGFLRSPELLVRAQAAFILGEIANSTALPMLRDAARQASPRADPLQARLMYLQMAEAMIKLGDENAIHEIRAALYPARPEDLEATALAAQILGQVKDRGSQSQLINLVAIVDPQAGPMPPEIRLASAQSLAGMGWPRAAEVAAEHIASPSGPIRAQSALVLGATGQRANLPALAPLLTDPEPMVAISAAAAVLKITDGPGVGMRPAAR